MTMPQPGPMLSAGAEELFLEAMAYLDQKYLCDSKRFPYLYELAILLFPAIYGRMPADVPQFVERCLKLNGGSASIVRTRAPVRSSKPVLRNSARDYQKAHKSLAEFKAWLAVELAK